MWLVYVFVIVLIIFVVDWFFKIGVMFYKVDFYG